jgi:hypothetical protein
MVSLDDTEILDAFSNFLNTTPGYKKTSVILRCVSKKFHNSIKPKSYYPLMKKLNFSTLNMIRMFIDSEYTLVFNDIMKSLRFFKNNITKFYRWNKLHWYYLLTFLIYRYIKIEYDEFIEDDEPFMLNYQRFIGWDFYHVLYISLDANSSIKDIYNIVDKYNSVKVRELILI